MEIIFKCGEKTQKVSEYGIPLAVYVKKQGGKRYTKVLFEDPKCDYQIGSIEYVLNPPTPWGQLVSVEVEKNAYAETPLFRQFPSFRFFRVPVRLARAWENGQILPYEVVDALVRSGYISKEDLGKSQFVDFNKEEA